MSGASAGENLGAFAPHNRLPVAIDIATGLLFFAVAKLSDLTTAALVAAAVGAALVLFQRITRIDVTGGLALFGIAMLLLSAAIAWFAADEFWVQMRSTVVGLIASALFIGDALLFRGQRLARALARYLPYDDLSFVRLGLGIGLSGALLAGLNAAVAAWASKDAWLFYTTFLDLPLTMVLMMVLMHWARGSTKPA